MSSPSGVPRHVGQGGIDEEGEQHHKQDVAAKTDAAGHAARDEGGCDDGELQLEQGEQKERNTAPYFRVRGRSDAFEIHKRQWVSNDAPNAVSKA